MIVYVATVSTRDEVMAVGATPEEAVALASAKALEYLSKQDALSEDTDTVEKVAEYFGVTASGFTVGSAGFAHEGTL